MNLSAQDFTGFFEQVWGHRPFDWQTRFVERLASGEGWPSIVDLPTGSGKSSLVDIALFHLAMDPRAPRRIVLVVDRRVLVDQATRRAGRLLQALSAPHPDSVCAQVAVALRSLTGDESAPLLQTTTLRGAMLRDDAWARRPDVPVLASSTVDQIGSRLFFRGYGVSDSMKPVHAGLVGCDTLLLLDEVHLARPFAESLAQLDAIRAAQSTGRTDLDARRTRVVTMSATPGNAPGTDVFQLEPADRQHPVLRGRLAASKLTRIEQVRVRSRDEEPTKRQALARAAVDCLEKDHLENGRRAMAIIVNRVDTARRAHQLATERFGDRCDVYLLTGRMRPLDQRALLDEILPRLEAGREDGSDRPLVLVTTQCIEAGADLDLDGLVSECASLDALRQRCGRVDRRGGRPGSTVTVLIRSDQTKNADPIYGDAMAATWKWMQERGDELDFGIDALDALLIDHPPDVPLVAPHREAPVLLPGWMDLWVQTRPRPHPDPDPALFLHGIPRPGENVAPDVQIIWRADLCDEDLEAPNAVHRNALVEAIAAVPPGSLEAMSVPVWAARKFLARHGDAGDVADVEGQGHAVEGSRRTGRKALVWQGRESQVVRAGEVRPGQTLIVPSTYGGMTEKTWNPEDESPVVDLGDAVQLEQRGRPSLRLSREVLAPFVVDELPKPGVSSSEMSPIDDARAWLEKIVLHPGREVPNALRTTVDVLRNARRCRLVARFGKPIEHSVLTTLRPMSVEELRASLGGESVHTTAGGAMDARLTSEGDLGSFTQVEVPLMDHLEGVEDWARRFTTNCALPDDIARSIELAAALHDAGKADPRFQLWLHGGDPIRAAMADGPLAKSVGDLLNAARRQRARKEAGYPAGQRHELVSLDMLERNEQLQRHAQSIGADWDLVLYLVSSHHGWCRPSAPPADIRSDDDEAVSLAWREYTLSGRTRHRRASYASGVPSRFFRLVGRYGAHELAWFESILRLADHRRSEFEQTRTDKEPA